MRSRALLALLLVAAAAFAAEPNSLSDLLPPETPLFLELRAPTAAEAKELCYYRCLAEPALQEVIARTRAQENSFTSMNLPLGHAARLTLESDLSPSDTFVHVRYEDAKGKRSFRIKGAFSAAVVGALEPPVYVDAAVAFGVEGDPAYALETIRRAVAAKVLEFRGDAFGDIDRVADEMFQRGEHRGVGYVRTQAGRVTLFAGPVGPFVAVTTSEARLRDMIDRGLDARADSLSNDPRHKAALALVSPGTRTMAFTLHFDRALDAFAPLLGPFADAARQGLAVTGLDTMRTLALVSGVDGTGITSTTSLLFEGERRGLALLFAAPGAPATCSALAFAPRNTFYVTCGRFDVPAIWNVIATTSGAGVPAEAAFRAVTGLRLREDLLDLLGPEAGLIVSTNQGIIPDIALVFDARDPAALEQSLGKLCAAIPMPDGVGIRSAKLGDASVRIVPFGDSRLGGVPVAPTFGIVDGKLLIAPFPLSFQRFMAVKRGAKPSILDNPDFQRLRTRVPEGALGVSYLDVPRMLAFYYDTVMPILQSLQQPDQGGGIYELPAVEDLVRHLYGRIGWRVVDDAGVHWKSHGAIDTNGLVLGGIVVGGALATLGVTAGESAREPEIVETVGPGPRDAEAKACIARVLRLKIYLRRYQHEHGNLPTALEAGPHLASDAFKVPGTDQEYEYFGARGLGQVLLQGRANGADKRITVLTKTFEIRRVTAEELERLKKP